MNNMPTVTKHLLIINILFFAGQWVAGLHGIDLTQSLGLHFFLSNNFHWYQLFTYMFLHGNLEHIFFNLFAVWMFGRIVENTMGTKRYIFYYFTCGLGAGLCQEAVQFVELLNGAQNIGLTVGASGAVYGILLAFGMTFPEERIFIFPLPVPIKAKYFVCGYAVIELLSALARSNDGVAHVAHLGGMLFGLLLILYWRNGRGRNRGGYYDNYYDRGSRGSSFRNWFSALRRKRTTPTSGGEYEKDFSYRQRKKEEEEQMDRILDKVKERGYEALSEEEKKKLFDFSKKL